MPIRTYPPEEWKLSPHVFLTPNMDWCPSVLNFTADEYAEYEEWLEQFGRWTGTTEHVVHTMTFNALTDNFYNFLFSYSLLYTDEPTSYNLSLEYLCGEMYPFIKPLSVRD